MPENIFNEFEYHSIIKRISRLTSISVRQGGQMDLPQMLQYCTLQVKRALGIIPVKKQAGSFLFRTAPGRWLSLYFFSKPKDLETAVIISKQVCDTSISFTKQQTELLQLISLLPRQQEFGLHPYYGRINKTDWGRLLWLYLDHHLQLFSN